MIVHLYLLNYFDYLKRLRLKEDCKWPGKDILLCLKKIIISQLLNLTTKILFLHSSNLHLFLYNTKLNQMASP